MILNFYWNAFRDYHVWLCFISIYLEMFVLYIILSLIYYFIDVKNIKYFDKILIAYSKQRTVSTYE